MLGQEDENGTGTVSGGVDAQIPETASVDALRLRKCFTIGPPKLSGRVFGGAGSVFPTRDSSA